MPIAYFRLKLTARPTAWGGAELVPPTVVRDTNYAFVIVKDGGKEGIARIDEPQSVLATVEEHRDCSRLTPKKAQAMREDYPKPKLKEVLRRRPRAEGAASAPGSPFQLDDQGKPIADTIQTVRSGFYLIDVPVLLEP